jgi:hypothetical protein
METITTAEGLYKITVTMDGEITWVKYFEYALDAAETFLTFVDHGMAKYERIVELESPDGSKRTKRFSTIAVAQ